jgi:amino-acid N-acetyltransferase
MPDVGGVVVRRASTSDVPAIKSLVDIYSGKILLEKNLVTLYEAVQEFWVAEVDGNVRGCGALHVLWSDLGEVRTVAVHPDVRGKGVGHAVVDRLLDVARDLHLDRIFVLTFEVEFFSKHGFEEIEGTPVTAEVYDEMCRSYDTGVAEFLDLSYVKPNILGNTRMLLTLSAICVHSRALSAIKRTQTTLVVVGVGAAPVAADRHQCGGQFVGFDQYLARLGSLAGAHDAAGLHQVHQAARLGETHPQLALQHRRRAELA